MGNVHQRITIWIVVLILFTTFGLFAGEGDLTMPSEHLVKLVLKTLTYDKALKTWDEDPIRIGIVASGDKVELGQKLLKDFSTLSEKKFLVGGHTFTAELLNDPSNSDQPFLGYLVLDTAPDRLLAISEAAQRDHVLTFTPFADSVNPMSIGFGLEGDKVTIYSCIECLKGEKVQLSAQFLKITRRR